MKELQEIIQAWDALCGQGEMAALATVVRVEGSSYRRPAARMLIRSDGQTVGSVSGGCLEADVVERAGRVITSGEPEVVLYDTTDDGDVVFGLGLGCKGIVRILIEPLSPTGGQALTLPAALLRERSAGVLATVFGGESPRWPVGAHFLLEQDGPGPMAFLEEAQEVLAMEASLAKTVATAEGPVDVFFEFIHPPLPVVVFGGGHDAVPLTRIAKELGWHVTVVDHRPTYAAPSRFPGTDAVLVSPGSEIPASLQMDKRTAVVIMTHGYVTDQALLAALLPSPAAYVGILGPKRRTEALLAELREDGQPVTEAMLARLHSPIGLDIGAQTPEQIALAIVAEIQARSAGRAGGFLRDRKGPIYDTRMHEDGAPGGGRLSCPRSA